MDDLIANRLDELDRRTERTDARFDRIDQALTDIKVQLARTATRGELWGAMATVLGGGLGLLGVIVAILTYLQAFPHPR